MILFNAPAPSPARAVSFATVSLSADYVRIGGTVVVSVADSGASSATIHTAETAGKTPYSLPAGSTNDTFVFQTLNPFLLDRDEDGHVTWSDITISIADAIPVSLVAVNGVFTLQLIKDVAGPIPFTVTYSAERIEQLVVNVSSPSDVAGFDLTLEETTAASGVFTGTFETGSATVIANATVPSASARPDIKAVDGDVITVTYTDTDPLSLVGNTILLDGAKPTVTVLSPAQNAFEQTFSSFMEVRVTDIDSGVNVDSIRFHYDGDGDNTFTEPGTIILPDAAMTTVEPTGVVVRVLIPSTSPDGLRTWYVTASDIAGNVGQSDSDAATTGNQVNIFTSDVNPPSVTSVVAGEWYDTVSKTVKRGNSTSVHVIFSEKISVASIVPSGFRLNNTPALSVKTYTDLPNDVFLTVGAYPTVVSVVLLIDAGSVTDLSGLEPSPAPTMITDKIPPVLTISLDRPATNSIVKISVSSDEPLAASPSITVNGLTRDIPTQVADQRWVLDFDIAGLTGLDAGQGVKTIGAAGFDVANNLGKAQPITFQVDNSVAVPVFTPSGAGPVSESFPNITVTYAAEAGEYTGDTHAGMSIILATLDGEPVATLMSTADAGVTWTLKGVDVRPDGYEKGVHVFAIVGVDVAGNAHDVAVTVFEITVDPPLPAPPEAEVDPAPIENTVDEPPDDSPGDSEEEPAPPQENAAIEDPDESSQPAGESSEVVDDAGTSDPAAEDESTGADGTDDGPPDETDASPEAQDVAAQDDSSTDGDAEPGITPVDDEEGPVEESDALVSNAGEPIEPSGSVDVANAVEPGGDPVFDREAEQLALDAAEDELTEHATSTPEESGPAIFGCNVPLGGSDVIGGEYALLGVGLLGLGFRRPMGALRDMLWPALR